MWPPVIKISRNDVTKWMAANKLAKTPSDLTPKELEQAAKDLKVDKAQLTTLLSATTFDVKAVETPVAQNKLNGDLAGAAVIHNHGRGVYDFES